MARTLAFLVAPTRLRVAGVQKGQSYHFRRPFLVRFLGEQKMNNISLPKANEQNCPGEAK
jgi:hypothetical protein